MRNSRKLFFVAVLAANAAFAACGDDDNLVRTRPDGGVDAAADAALEGSVLACGVPIPSVYLSPNFAINAKEELDLKSNVLAIGDKMKSAEGATPAAVTAGDLNTLFNAGTPSLRQVATAYTQSTVDAYITQFADAATKTWMPSDADADAGGVDGGSDGGIASGGKYAGASIFSATGLNFREATQKLLLNGALYNYALVLASGAITEGTIDRFVALYGATPSFANRSDVEAGALQDQLIAGFASQRDNKLPQSPGPYTKIAHALRAAKAAASGGDKCRGDLASAMNIYFLEWEKTSYLTVIYDLNQAATKATASPQLGEPALRAFGAAIGAVESFRGIPQDRRKITDTQIDTLMTHIGGATPYQLVTKSNERAVAFNGAFNDIGAVYSLTPTQIEDAKKAY